MFSECPTIVALYQTKVFCKYLQLIIYKKIVT